MARRGGGGGGAMWRAHARAAVGSRLLAPVVTTPCGWVGGQRARGGASAATVAALKAAEAAAAPAAAAAASTFTAAAPYPLWYLSPDGAAYQAVYALNVRTAALLEWLHAATGLPWWATIVATTLGVRALFLPAAVHVLRNTSRMVEATPELQVIAPAVTVSLSFIVLCLCT